MIFFKCVNERFYLEMQLEIFPKLVKSCIKKNWHYGSKRKASSISIFARKVHESELNEEIKDMSLEQRGEVFPVISLLMFNNADAKPKRFGSSLVSCA